MEFQPHGSRFPVECCPLAKTLGEEFVKDIICGICRDILDSPLVTPCDHHFCSLCCKGLKMAGVAACPLCHARTFGVKRKLGPSGQPINGWLFERPAKSFMRLLNGTPMRCNNPGCEKVVPLGDFLIHKSERCDCRLIKCPSEGCGMLVQWKQLRPHLDACLGRKLLCDSCSQWEPDNKDDKPSARCEPWCVNYTRYSASQCILQIQKDFQVAREATPHLCNLMRQLADQQQIISALRRDLDEAPASHVASYLSAQERTLYLHVAHPAHSGTRDFQHVYPHWSPSDNTPVDGYSSENHHSQNTEDACPPDGSASEVPPVRDHGEIALREIFNSPISGSSTGAGGQRDTSDVEQECSHLRGAQTERTVPIVMFGLAKLPSAA